MPMNPRLLRPRAAASTAFDPRQIAGLGLWLDAADTSTVTLNAGNVSEWRDKSGEGRHASQSNSGNRPSLTTMNSLDSLLFDGSSDSLLTESFALAQPLTIFAVSQHGGGDDGTGFLFDGGGGERTAIYRASAGNWRFYAGSESADIAASDAAPSITCAVFNGASSLFRLNGTQVSSNNTGSQGVDDGLVIGSADGSVACWPGKISEIIVYSGAKTTGEIEQTEAYLSAKWIGTP